MKQEINPKDTNRAMAFELWMKSPMPMVTLTKTFDVTRLCRVSHRRGIKFNMLLCWCIGKTASRIDEFYLLPEQGKLMKYDRLAINVIVNNKGGGINSCDILYTNDLEQFGQDYMVLTQSASTSCQSSSIYFCDAKGFKGMMLRGTMEVLTDAASKEMIWHNGDEQYYPGGVTDPNYCVLKFTATDGRFYSDFYPRSFVIE